MDSSASKKSAERNPLETSKRHTAHFRETQQAYSQQWVGHQIDTILEAHAIIRLALQDAQVLSILWVQNQFMLQRLIAKLKKGAAKLARWEALGISKGGDEGYGWA